ncbi:hypothetical protein F511_07840 [Dorcoceras hygrometricum]|uniref:Uncharacterized protein n=1 Tax=Dorcoceras hygrometricum TaxID=472368 RepID=A0A2Z7B5M7_9LAMI|nr:hypothetical protein F511_07840 [Dorcoceras hygrometricum]
MAYVALVSVSQILDSDAYLFLPCSKEELESFRETIASLLAFLDDSPPICTQTIDDLVTRIRDSAYEAEDVVESLVATHFLQKYEDDVYEKGERLHQAMEKVMEDIESAMKVLHHGNEDHVRSHDSKHDMFVMAYTAIDPVSQILGQILDSDQCHFPCTKEKVMYFRETVASFVNFLFSSPPTSQDNIMDSFYQAKDILDSLVETHLLRNYGTNRYERFKVFSGGLQKVMKDIRSIEKEVRKIQVHGQRIQTPAGPASPTFRGYHDKMVVLDKELEMRLLEQLVGERSEIEVVPIVGMGGIGKTTLARILCDCKLVRETFEVRGWATISETYSVHATVVRILKDIGVSWDGKKDPIQVLYQRLYNRKFLIVLDDVWSSQAWDDLRRLFPDNSNCSRIILTTRHSSVAEYANTFTTYHTMQPLNEDSSWSLLCKEIFRQNNCPPELVEIGKTIARQCQGLPLAISAIGGHLKKEKLSEEYWKYISKNLKSVLEASNDGSLEILTKSYNYLPHRLKACFLYFGSFPENRPIDVSRLVRYWVAEGFIKPSTSKRMEEVAEEYLRDVIERNLVSVHEYDAFGKPKTCGIHDLFRYICVREARKEKFLCILDREDSFHRREIKSQRRLILSTKNVSYKDESPFSSLASRDGSCPATRSLICHGTHTTSSIIKLAPGLLKVFNLSALSIGFQVAIFELVNLKYLELSDIYIFPPSISRLWNLQTLISYSSCIKYIPSEIWKMPQLRHLLMFGFHLPDVQEKGTNTCILKSLQTLSSVIDFRCTNEVLDRIPNLRKLKIEYQEDERLFFHTLNNLVDLRELESLRCYFHFGLSGDILQSLSFPLSLKKLVLKGCQIPWNQMSIIGVLPNLEVLKLKSRAVVGNLWETNDEEFKQLRFLSIHDSDIVDWRTEIDHFPRLRRLILKDCEHLVEIPSEIGEIPTLEIIELHRCSRAAESSAEEILGEDSEIELKIVK